MSDRNLRIRTFGGLSITRGAERVEGFASRKAEALLVYLACNPRSHPRERLADLFWDGRSQRQAMANLRVSLSSLHKLLAAYVTITRTTVSINEQAGVWLDAARLEQAVVAMQEEEGSRTAETMRALEEVLALYEGDFLAGFFLREAAGFEAWTVRKREQLHRLCVDALCRLAEWHLQQGAYAAAIRWATRTVGVEPLSEVGHRRLMEALARNGQRTQALAQFEACRQRLAEAFGVEPQDETRALNEAIHDGTLTPLASADSSQAKSTSLPNNLPLQPTPFFGRVKELAELEVLLVDPGARLITITGLAGIGKSRLALHLAAHVVAERSRLFPHGVTFVPLAGISHHELAPVIGSALGITFVGHDAPERQLLRYLRDKELLLLLDNYEHLLPEAELLASIVAEAPHVKLLVTSRHRLALVGEWLYQLEGLGYPDPADFPMEAAEVERYDAVSLFASRARQINHTFSLARWQQEVAHICKLVQGMPLALEMSAAWLKSLAPDEVLAEMRRGLSLLSSQARNVPRRHRSLRAVFDATWTGLSLAEQRVLSCLSLFYTDFSREAATAVTGATLPVLRSLSDKSLIRLTPAGRYELHELLRQYAAEKLAIDTDARADAVARYCRFYGVWLSRREQDLLATRQEEAFNEIRSEIDNIRRAWRWAVAEGLIRFLDQSCWTLSFFYELQGWYAEARDLMRRAVDGLRLLEMGDGEQKALWGRLRLFRAHFLNRTGQLAESQVVLEETFDLLLECGTRRDAAMAYVTLGQDISDLGDRARAEECFRQALAICRKHQVRWLKPLVEARLCSVLTLKNEQDAWNEAEILAREALAYAQQADNPFAIFSVSLYYGRLFRRRGNFEQAQRIHQQGLQAARRINHLAAIGLELREIGLVNDWQGKLDAARACYTEGRQFIIKSGDRLTEAAILNDMAEIARREGNDSRARAAYQESLAIFEELDAARLVALVRCNLGHVLCRQKMFGDALACFTQSLRVFHDQANLKMVGLATAGIAAIVACQDHAELAAVLLGAATARFEEAKDPMWPTDRDDWERITDLVQTRLEGASFTAVRERGRALPSHEAVALAYSAAETASEQLRRASG